MYESSVEIGKITNNVAELEAIHDALWWIIESSVTALSSGMLFRVYAHSNYSRDVQVTFFVLKSKLR